MSIVVKDIWWWGSCYKSVKDTIALKKFMKIMPDVIICYSLEKDISSACTLETINHILFSLSIFSLVNYSAKPIFYSMCVSVCSFVWWRHVLLSWPECPDVSFSIGHLGSAIFQILSFNTAAIVFKLRSILCCSPLSVKSVAEYNMFSSNFLFIYVLIQTFFNMPYCKQFPAVLEPTGWNKFVLAVFLWW